jgi:hypothetical protein
MIVTTPIGIFATNSAIEAASSAKITKTSGQPLVPPPRFSTDLWIASAMELPSEIMTIAK